MASSILFHVEDNIATITLNRPKQLNALTLDDIALLAKFMRQAADNEKVTITILTGSGKYFSAGADVRSNRGNTPEDPNDDETRKFWLGKFTAGNIDVTRAFISHPKILIAALNGPAVGLSAALVAHCDFIYATPSTFLLTPFASLGLVAEGGTSHTFVKRLGLSTANAALITAARIPASQLLACGFVNQIFTDPDFPAAIGKHVHENFQGNLNRESMLRIKALIRAGFSRELEATNSLEHFAGLERFAQGVPQKAFALVAAGKVKHKL